MKRRDQMIYPDAASAVAAGACSWDLNAWSRARRDPRPAEVDHDYYHACGQPAAVVVYRRTNGGSAETPLGLLCADHEKRSRRAVGAMQGVDLDRYRWGPLVPDDLQHHHQHNDDPHDGDPVRPGRYCGPHCDLYDPA